MLLLVVLVLVLVVVLVVPLLLWFLGFCPLKNWNVGDSLLRKGMEEMTFVKLKIGVLLASFKGKY